MDKNRSGLSPSRERLIRECETSGALNMFGEVMRAMNSRPPNDMKAFFVRFATDAEFIFVRKEYVEKFEALFGKKVSFVRAHGVAMVHHKGEPLSFLQSRELEVNPSPPVRRNGSPVRDGVVATKLGDVPEGSSLYLSALKDFNGKEARDGRKHGPSMKSAVFCRSSTPAPPRLVARAK